jgi:hypothetical protein
MAKAILAFIGYSTLHKAVNEFIGEDLKQITRGALANVDTLNLRKIILFKCQSV